MSNQLDKQIEEFQRSTELQWRPYLQLQFTDSIFFSMAYFQGETYETDTVHKDLSEINIETEEFFSVQRIAVALTSTAMYWNTGASPLRMKASGSGIITQEDWFKKFKKSPELLMDLFIDSIKSFATDVIISPRDTLVSDKPWTNTVYYSKNYFKSQIENESCLYLYPFTYIQYEDLFQTSVYDVLRMEVLKIPVVVTDGIVIPSIPDSVRYALEKYPTDVYRNKLR